MATGRTACYCYSWCFLGLHQPQIAPCLDPSPYPHKPWPHHHKECHRSPYPFRLSSPSSPGLSWKGREDILFWEIPTRVYLLPLTEVKSIHSSFHLGCETCCMAWTRPSLSIKHAKARKFKISFSSAPQAYIFGLRKSHVASDGVCCTGSISFHLSSSRVRETEDQPDVPAGFIPRASACSWAHSWEQEFSATRWPNLVGHSLGKMSSHMADHNTSVCSI